MKPQVFHLSSLTFWSLSLVFYHLYHVLPFTHHTHCWRSKYAKISQILICSLIGGQCTEVKKCQIFIVGNCKRYVCYILAHGEDKGFLDHMKPKVKSYLLPGFPKPPQLRLKMAEAAVLDSGPEPRLLQKICMLYFRLCLLFYDSWR